MEEKLELDLKKLQKQHERDVEDLRRKLERKRETMADQLDDEVGSLFMKHVIRIVLSTNHLRKQLIKFSVIGKMKLAAETGR